MSPWFHENHFAWASVAPRARWGQPPGPAASLSRHLPSFLSSEQEGWQ